MSVKLKFSVGATDANWSKLGRVGSEATLPPAGTRFKTGRRPVAEASK